MSVSDRITKLTPEQRAVLRARLQKKYMEGGDSIPPRPDPSVLPLSFSQERLWFLDQLEPGAQYNDYTAYRFTGPLNVAALERSLNEVVRRHEALRSIFPMADGEPTQVVLPEMWVGMPVADVSALPEGTRTAEAERLGIDEVRRPFDLATGPLVRALALRTAPDDHRVVLNMHHIVCDGWSALILNRELGLIYDALSRGVAWHLPELPIQYADYAHWQRQWLRGGVLEKQAAWWKERLAGAPPLLEMPADRPRPRARSGRGTRLYLILPGHLAAGLQTLAQREGVTGFMAQLAVVTVLLHRWSGQDDFSIGTPTAGRNRVELEGMIGFFVNTLVLRMRLDGGPSFREVLRRVREATVGAFAHQDIPFERLVEEVQPDRDLAYTPLFQVMFASQVGGAEAPPEMSGEGSAAQLGMVGLPISNQTAKFDLVFHFWEEPGGLGGWMELDVDLYDTPTVLRLLGHLEVLLDGLVAAPDAPVSTLPLLTAAERQQVVHEWNDWSVARPEETIPEMILAQAARTPDALALVFGNERLSYADAFRRAAALAGHLRALGVGPDAPVGICLERSMELLIAALGVFLAGGAVVPLDPAHPEERLRFMLEDSGARVVIRSPSPPGPLSHPLPPDRERGDVTEAMVVELREEAADAFPLSRQGGGGWERGPGGEGLLPDHLGYVIFTSGTTGRAKGIALTQRALVNMVRWHLEAYGGGRRVLGFSSFSFDVFYQELLTALASGGSLHLLSKDAQRDAEAMARFIEAERIEEAILAVVVLQQIAETVAGRPASLASLRWVTTVGEAMKITPAVARLFEALPEARLRNFYGPAETHGIVAYTLSGPPSSWPAGPPIGRPIANSRIHLLDRLERHASPVPAIVLGELTIGGAALARGYAGRPDLTAERFVPDPFSEVPGERLYRTGDLARWRPDGVIEFLGRIDHQVKIRGVRIEPAEIEAALVRHPAVREAVVLVHDEGGPTGKRLVAYVVMEGEAPSSEALRSFLATSLPEAMLPSVIVPLDRMPLTPHGKVDRRVLADLGAAAPAAAEEGGTRHAPPRDALEETVAGLWEEVLGVERPGIHESFFALGGHSLLATRLLSRLRKVFEVELPLRDLFERPTIAELAARVRSLTASLAGPPLPAIEPRPTDSGEPPLSFSQQRLWFLDRLQPGSAAYNLPAGLRLEGDLDVPVFAAALEALVQRHETLRTSFPEVDGAPVQRIAPVAPASLPPLPVIDLQALPHEAREAEARRHFAAEATRPFDLARGPLLRVRLLRLGPTEHVAIILLHHIISDGWSMEVLVRETSVLYASFRQGLPLQPAPLPPLPVQYADYALWQRRWLQGEALERQLAYWKEKLAGVPPTLDLPTDRPRPPVQSARGAVRWRRIPAELAGAVRSLARRESATLFTTLLAAFQVLLARHAHQEDFALGSPFAGRGRLETEGLIGFFVNTLALRADLSGEPAFTDVLARARATVLEAQTHSDLPFERLVEELHPERLLDRSPIFQVMFGAQVVDQSPSGSSLELDDIQVHVLLPETMAVKFDMNVTFLDLGDAFNAGVEYSADLFDPATVDRLLDRYEVLLAAAAVGAGVPALTLPLLTADEQRQILIEETETGFPPAGLLHARFTAQAERTPEAVALVRGDERRTYRETAEAARRLARHLLALGLPPEGRVGIWRETSIDAVVALLAILEAGGAYVPLDPSYPVERLRFMAADAGLSALIVRGEDPFSDIAVPRVDLERDAAVIASRSAALLGLPIAEEALAYVLYTSGSTGRPKGVACPHAGAVRLVDDLLRRAPLPEGAVSSIWTSLAFDVSICEVFGALAGGGRLEIPPAVVRTEGPVFASWLAERGIESAYVPPVLVPDLVVRATSKAKPALRLRRLIVGAEPVREPLLTAIARALPGIQILNGYGPTESAIFSTFQEIGPQEGNDRNAPIGRPVAGTRAVLLDRRLEPVPPGVAGELFLSGGGLARGYLGRPDLTAERFLPDPFAALAGNPGGRAYRTGDLALLRPDGSLEFLGRTDLQVKLRGFRIELGEVEAALRACPGVRDAAAVVREDRPGDRRLVAYLAGTAETSVGDLRALLRERLPGPMVPSSFVFLEALPLTPSGKVDRRALPAPGGSVSREGVAPRDPLERELAGIWEEILGVRPIGVQDDFFELGGHSLLGAALMGRVRERFGHDLPVATLFRRSTVEELATILRGWTSPASSLVTLRADGQRSPLVLVHPVGGHALCYAPLADLLADRPLLAFEATGRETTVEEMAERYLEELGSRPIGVLGGWSMGGLVAFEMARRRTAAGHPVELVVLFDTVAPGHQGDPPSAADLLLSFAADLADRLGLGISSELVESVRALDPEAGLTHLLKEARRHGLPLDLDGARHLFRLFSTNEAAMRSYAGGPYEGRGVLFRPEGAAHDAAAGWTALAPNLEIVAVPGDHYSLLRPPHVEVLAERLGRVLG
jgi:amino acid adenylation domain-containing protein